MHPDLILDRVNREMTPLMARIGMPTIPTAVIAAMTPVWLTEAFPAPEAGQTLPAAFHKSLNRIPTR